MPIRLKLSAMENLDNIRNENVQERRANDNRPDTLENPGNALISTLEQLGNERINQFRSGTTSPQQNSAYANQIYDALSSELTQSDAVTPGSQTSSSSSSSDEETDNVDDAGIGDDADDDEDYFLSGLEQLAIDREQRFQAGVQPLSSEPSLVSQLIFSDQNLLSSLEEVGTQRNQQFTPAYPTSPSERASDAHPSAPTRATAPAREELAASASRDQRGDSQVFFSANFNVNDSPPWTSEHASGSPGDRPPDYHEVIAEEPPTYEEAMSMDFGRQTKL